MGIIRWFSFIGISFVSAILFGVINLFHLKEEESHSGSFLEKLLFLLMIPFGFLGFPALILSAPVLRLYDSRSETLYKKELSQKYDLLLNTYKRQLDSADVEIAGLKELVWDERLTRNQEEYKNGERAGFRNGFKAGFSYCYDYTDFPADEKWDYLTRAWDSIDFNVRMCEESKHE